MNYQDISKNALESVQNDNPDFGNRIVNGFGAGSWRNSTEYEDKCLHIDIFYKDVQGNEFPIDIKKMNSKQRGQELDCNYHWIQVTNKLGGNGALFGSSYYFGFINSQGYLLTPMENVRKFYEAIIDKKDIRTINPQTENILYSRRCYDTSSKSYYNTPETSFLMRYKDLYMLSHFCFPDSGGCQVLPSVSSPDWVDYYIKKIKKAYTLKNSGMFDTTYDTPEEIYNIFLRENVKES